MQSDLLKLVRDQYEKYPYPHYPIWTRVRPAFSLHASYEAGVALTQGRTTPSAGIRILLLGCGTLEPAALASLHPRAIVTAVDLSRKSLRHARLRCLLRPRGHVEFVQDDLIHFARTHAGQFDYVHCYGVLHHLENPAEGFKAVAQALKPGGIARIMVYSRSHRRRQSLFIKALNGLQIRGRTSENIRLVRQFIKALPDAHPFKALALLNSDINSDQGLVDALLHACEHSFTIDELHSLTARAQLQIAAFDLNQSMRNLIQDLTTRPLSEEPATTPNILDQIRRLEAFSQWPGSFTFWVTKTLASKTLPSMSPAVLTGGATLWLNPHFRWRRQKSFYSVILRKTLQFTAAHHSLLEALSASPGSKVSLSSDQLTYHPSALEDLLSSRIILAISEQVAP